MKTLKINNVKPIQEDFWGNGVVYHGFAGMPDDAGRVYTEEQCDLEAKRVADMGIKFVRTRYDWWAWDKETKTWNWDNDYMQPFYRWLQRMKNIGVTVSLNTGWCSPGDILSNTWTGISPFTVEGDWEASVKNFGDWVSETVHQIVELRGFTNVKCLTLFTEPQHFGGNGQPMFPDQTPHQCWYDSAKAAHDALVRDGRRHLVKLMGPNEGSTETSEMVNWVANQELDFIDIYSSHTYQLYSTTPYYFIENDITAVTDTCCGGRTMTKVELKPDTEYTAVIDFCVEDRVDRAAEPDKEVTGRLLFGVYRLTDNLDLYDNSTDLPVEGISEDSLFNITPDMFGEGKTTLSFKFKTNDVTVGMAGIFFDVRTPFFAWVSRLDILDADGNSYVNNPCFKDYYKDWNLIFVCGIDPYQDWYRWCHTGIQYVPKGKGYCFDEYNVIYTRDNTRPQLGAEMVNAAVAFMNVGAQSSLLWTGFDQQWPSSHATNWDSFFDGEQRLGLMPTLTRSLVPYKAFYAFSLISKYVSGEGTKVYEGMSTKRIATTMSVSPNGDITVIVVNCKESADEFEILFDKSLDGVKFNRHTFDPATCVPDEKAEIVGIDKITEPITDKLCDKIAAYGVQVYTTIKD